MDDRFTAENWNPSDYGPPDLARKQPSPPPRKLTDRENAWVHYALQGFLGLMAEHEQSIGRELTAGERYRHIQRFEGHLLRKYGVTAPDPGWLSRHEAWHGRHGAGV